jgi:hypothetical protein
MRNLKIGLLILVVVVFVAVGIAWHHDSGARIDHGAADGPLVLTGPQIERGRYLSAAADCMVCHTRDGGEDYAGGVAFVLPFGTLYSSNLTPDPASGIGTWTDEEFIDAVRAGVAPGGRHLYPAHPYTSYAGMARNDVLAIRAYLATLPPVAYTPPANVLLFPFSQRGLMTFWNALYQPAVGFMADPSKDAAATRGAYLANALGHCGECHTSRNAFYAPNSGKAYAGAITNGWKAYDITAAGLAAWSESDLEAYLATGFAKGHGVAAGSMKAVVAYDTAQLSADDRSALVRYLLAGRADAVPVAAVASVADEHSNGAALYAGACMACHATGPVSIASGYGDLSGASTVRDPKGTNLLHLLASGSGHGGGSPDMPAFSGSYSDAERAALANYVLARWGGLAPTLTAQDASVARQP